jgi:predicted TIM-barrel fold metal-dependent hydrolase
MFIPLLSALLKEKFEEKNNMRTILQAFLEGDGFPNELVIDAHTHIGRGFDGSRRIEETAQRALTRMDAVGIDASCVMGSQYLIEGDYRDGNNDLLWLHEHYPDRFVCFTNINPHDKKENVLVELQRMYDAGIRGIKLINAYQNYPSNGPVLWALYEFAAERKLIVLNHSWGSSETIDLIASTFPDMTMIIGHHTDGADDLLRKFPNLYLCTWSFVIPHQIEKAIKRIGADKIVFGSDAIINPFSAGLGPVVFARISDDEKRKILGLNMAQLLAKRGYNF